jgi:hypothetical protein
MLHVYIYICIYKYIHLHVVHASFRIPLHAFACFHFYFLMFFLALQQDDDAGRPRLFCFYSFFYNFFFLRCIRMSALGGLVSVLIM